jgi:Na+/proline symporter
MGLMGLLAGIDWLVIAVYFIAVFGVAFWMTRREATRASAEGSSVFNSCSTLFTWDIYKKLRPQAREKTLVLVGQISTMFLVVFGLAWIPMMKLISGQLYQYLQSVQAYISPPIAHRRP